MAVAGQHMIDREFIKWLRQQAQAGDVEAQALLADAYDEGVGVRKDSRKAVHWYRKAAVRGMSARSDR